MAVKMTETEKIVIALQDRVLSMSTECLQMQATLKTLNKREEKFIDTCFLDAANNLKDISDSLDEVDSLLCTDLIVCRS